ncbi:MAG TPA: DNA-binding response regulator, partial [Gammaproteobacteria bacterium]|nr:DNA-binding response regulator [Gammaproteobacteria bacterium]
MANIKVLVVDDEFSIRQMIVMSLQSNGYDVVEAEDANSAKAMIVDDRPDLVLLDWMMPGMSGLD